MKKQESISQKVVPGMQVFHYELIHHARAEKVMFHYEVAPVVRVSQENLVEIEGKHPCLSFFSDELDEITVDNIAAHQGIHVIRFSSLKSGDQEKIKEDLMRRMQQYFEEKRIQTQEIFKNFAELVGKKDQWEIVL